MDARALSSTMGGPAPRTPERGGAHLAGVARAARRALAFAGPGAMIAVGYMDPGNWATDIAGGSRFSYALLSVVLASGLMAMLLQTLSARLGIATGEDLAAGCRSAWPRVAGGVCAAAILCLNGLLLADLVRR